MRVLVIDTGSPTASVVVRHADRVAVRTRPQRESAAPLLQLIDECLSELGLELTDLDAMAALRGPGSFTGLRVGLSLILGLHQSSGIPAGAASTLEVLAAVAAGHEHCVACVDALRGHWFVQRFERGRAASPPQRLAADDLVGWPSTVWVGVGIGSVDLSGERIEPPLLAPLAASLIASGELELDPQTLTKPLYLQDPALTLPNAPKRVGE